MCNCVCSDEQRVLNTEIKCTGCGYKLDTQDKKNYKTRDIIKSLEKGLPLYCLECCELQCTH